MDRRLVVMVIAFAAALVAVAFVAAAALEGVVAYAIRALENCAPPCAIGPPPPEPLVKQIAMWSLVVAFVAFDAYLIKAILNIMR